MPGQLNKAVAFSLNFVRTTYLRIRAPTTPSVLLEVFQADKKEGKAPVPPAHTVARVHTHSVSLAEGTANYNASEMAGFQVDNMVRAISFFHYQMGWIM